MRTLVTTFRSAAEKAILLISRKVQTMKKKVDDRENREGSAETPTAVLAEFRARTGGVELDIERDQSLPEELDLT